MSVHPRRAGASSMAIAFLLLALGSTETARSQEEFSQAGYGSVRHFRPRRQQARHSGDTGVARIQRREIPRASPRAIQHRSEVPHAGVTGVQRRSEIPHQGISYVRRRPSHREPRGNYGSVRHSRFGTGSTGGQLVATTPQARSSRNPVASLPEGSKQVRVADQTYYQAGSRYYRPRYDGGTVVYSPVPVPPGTVATELAANHQTVVVKGKRYYYQGGAYYVSEETDGKTRYVAVKPPKEVATGADTPDPLELVSKMSDYLGKLQSFRFRSTSTMDHFLDSGRKVKLSSNARVDVVRPRSVRAEIDADEDQRSSWYDGKSLTTLDRAKNQYATVAMPDTIDAALDDYARRYGTTMPLADLLYADAYAALITDSTNGRFAGTTKIDGVECFRLKFSTDRINWQVWIPTQQRPLPLKIAIAYKTVPGVPRFSARITKWELSPDLPENHFEFTPPADADKIEIIPVVESPARR